MSNENEKIVESVLDSAYDEAVESTDAADANIKVKQKATYVKGMINDKCIKIYVREQPVDPPVPIETLKTGAQIFIDSSYKFGPWSKIKTISGNVGYLKTEYISFI